MMLQPRQTGVFSRDTVDHPAVIDDIMPVGDAGGEMPQAAEALLTPYRIVRFG